MAIGDDAAAAGMDTVNPLTDNVQQGADHHNLTRDYVAQRTNAVQPVAKGGTGANTAAQALTNLGALPLSEVAEDGNVAEASKVPIYNTFGNLTAVDPSLNGHVATAGWTQAYAPSRAEVQALHDSVASGNMDPDIYSRIIGGVSVYITSGGLLGHVPSTREVKKNITDAKLDPEAIRGILVRTYQYRAAVALGDEWHIGVIAEELESGGFGWLVAYTPEGKPMSVRYELVGLVALALAQDTADRVDGIESRLSALEGISE